MQSSPHFFLCTASRRPSSARVCNSIISLCIRSVNDSLIRIDFVQSVISTHIGVEPVVDAVVEDVVQRQMHPLGIRGRVDYSEKLLLYARGLHHLRLQIHRGPAVPNRHHTVQPLVRPEQTGLVQSDRCRVVRVNLQILLGIVTKEMQYELFDFFNHR